MNKIEDIIESRFSDLLCRDGYVNYLIRINDDTEYKMSFEVFEVDSWKCDEAKTPLEISLYITGTIKWDGCSHVLFGEKDEKGNQDGYLHLCGRYFWTQHCEVMAAIYDLAEKTIKKYDTTVGA